MPSRTGLAYHERFLAHDTGAGHPESPDRLRSIIAHLREVRLWERLRHLIIDEAEEEWITRVHGRDHLLSVRDSCREGRRVLDGGDTHVSRESYGAALLAAGAVLAGVDAVMGGLLDNVFCAVRPPGHHAERNEVMGFCLFNNVAIGARYAQLAHGAGRVAVIDWDVHHGNGTQHIFFDDRTVLYVSLHQYPFYPGTGDRMERGIGGGDGYTLNIPMREGSSGVDYREAFTGEILPALDRFRPDLIMISAGFDAHRLDPLAGINLSEESFAMMTDLLKSSAATHCGGRLVSVLEGGYHLGALARSVEAHVRCLLA